MTKFTFKSHDNTETKEIVGFGYDMLPSGSYIVYKGCFDKPIMNCKHWYLAKAEKC